MLDANPYAPPRAAARPPLPSYREVSRWWRLGGFIIDATVIIAGDALALTATPITVKSLDQAGYGIFALAHLGTFAVLYYGLLEALFQRTVGKALLRMRVTTLEGDKPRLRHILLRTAARLVPFEQLTFLTPGPGFHDASSGTRVQRPAR
jgi:uncharacterized RDD family membrane protein YckC